MKILLLTLLFMFSLSYADEVNSRLVVRIDGFINIYSITYKGQEFLIITKGGSITVVPILQPGQKTQNIPAAALKTFKLK
jgi:hypothetical protein